uniref:Interleukin n=1 Tax=Callorhinchus milii TaxID=7868 RepID=V9LDN1_CALMI
MQFAVFKQRHVKRVCFCCYLNLTLDVFTFINTEAGLCLLLLCSLSVCLPKVEGDSTTKLDKKHGAMREMMSTLMNLNKSLSIPASISDLTLYSPENVPENCFDAALLCFMKEMKTLEFEMKLVQSKNHQKLSICNQMLTTYKRLLHELSDCKPCEEFQEKNVTSFLSGFISLLQQIIKFKSVN